MASEFGGDLYDFENMSDDEIRSLVLEQLSEYPNLDVDDMDVVVRNGVVILSGRVGTDAEVQVAGAVLDDILGLEDYRNELVVDQLRRGDMPEAADDANAAAEEEDGNIGVGNEQQSDTADHLTDDLETETYGTHDTGTAIRDGTAYTPPDRPVSEGYGSREEH